MDRSRIDSARRRLRYAWILVSMLAALGACAGASAQDKGARFDDAVITQRVSSALDADPVLRQMHIAVETRDGVVRLTGFVDSTAQIDRAAALARRIEGVSAVRNAIRVINRPSRA
jgi:osmotically-inducible protein OsmY